MEDQGLAVRIPQPVEEGTDPGNGGEGWQCPKRNAAGRKVRDGSGHEGTVSGERNRAYPGHLRCSNFILGIYVVLKKPVNTPFLADLFPYIYIYFRRFSASFFAIVLLEVSRGWAIS